MPPDAIIYKLEDAGVWVQATRAGVYTGAPVDHADGFIHLSTQAQVRETARKHFFGRKNLVLVALDSQMLGASLVWEPSRGGALFPHLYAPVIMRAVLSVTPLPFDNNGHHIFPEEIA